jgi:glycosyltransferase involved in cell wall biosynthesis
MNLILDNIIFSLQNHGGISVVWYELVKRLLVDTDFEIQFLDNLNNNYLRQQLEIPSANLLKDPQSKLPFRIQRYLNPKIDSEKAIFHSSYFRTVNNPNVLNITTVHDFTYEHYSRGLALKIHSLQKANAIKHSKRIISVSQNTKADLLHFYPKIEEEQVEVIYNGVSDDYFPIIEAEKSSVFELIPFHKGEYVISVGDRKSKYKNFRMLVDACHLSKFSLVLVGGGSLSKNEKLLLDEKVGQLNYIHLSGIENIQLNKLYNNAAFLIYPSSYEGFGIPIIEAQKAGCPVICSNKSSIPEVAGNAAFIIEDISSVRIAKILRDNLSRTNQVNKIIKEGFVNAQRFSWDKCYEQTKQVYLDAYSSF